MPSATVSELEILISGMVKLGAKLDAAQLRKIADAVGRVFSVQSDEVAILSVTADGRSLRFRVPEQLQAVGTIPLTSTTSLAVRTARDKRPEIVNHFNIVPHASVFEAVRINAERSEPIQKIMSAPIAVDAKVIGVIQVSRKAKTARSARDFSPSDLKQLVSITALVASALPLCEG
ncbi:MAG TPA: GAF domain-containing protein [Candidatus Acidoferrales bacterium]|nr:GAF domain-containing protein [Candidatus Acidoferrales bacterium]